MRPGIFTNSAGYVYDTGSSGSYKRVYSWYGKKVKNSVHPRQYSFSEGSLEMSSTYYTGQQWKRGYILHPTSFSLAMRDSIPYAPLWNRLLDKLNEEARGSLDLSVDLAEAGSTTRMFNALNHLNDFNSAFFGKHLRAGRLQRLFEATKWAGKQLLTYNYGVKPLINSVYGAADESLRICINKTARHKIRVSEERDKFQLAFYTYSNRYTGWLNATGLEKRSLTMMIEITTPQQDLSRWTSLNPLSLMYELTPYSFVLDWFVDIGSYLRNYETALLYNSRFNGGFVSELNAVDAKVCDVDSQPYGWNTVYQGSARIRHLERSLLHTYPVPRLPTFEADLGSSRLMSAAALLSQFLNKRS